MELLSLCVSLTGNASSVVSERAGLYYSGHNWHFAHENKEFEHLNTDRYTIIYKQEKVDRIPERITEMRVAEQAEGVGQVRELMQNYGPIDVCDEMAAWMVHSREAI